MERFTEQETTDGGSIITHPNNCGVMTHAVCEKDIFWKIVNKLKEYEDLEEQGELLKLPSKEVYESDGDTVFYIYFGEIVECINCGVRLFSDGKLYFILGCSEKIFSYRSPDAEHDTDPSDWCKDSIELPIGEWNKTVFWKIEQAEDALQKMNEREG